MKLAIATSMLSVLLSAGFACAQSSPATSGQPAPAKSKAAPAKAKKPAAKTIEGSIVEFICGDNCYLTIKTARGQEDGLCEAKICVGWFENQEMPKSFVGRKVRATLGTGVQRDSAGTVMGKMTSFKTLEFIK